MRKAMVFESDNKKMFAQPIIIKDTGELAFVKLTLYSHEDININVDDITEVIELLQAVKEVYIDKVALL